MGFLEHIGNSLTSIQPWQEFPPGHPRHGKQQQQQQHQRLLQLAIERSCCDCGFNIAVVLRVLLFWGHDENMTGVRRSRARTTFPAKESPQHPCVAEGEIICLLLLALPSLRRAVFSRLVRGSMNTVAAHVCNTTLPVHSPSGGVSGNAHRAFFAVSPAIHASIIISLGAPPCRSPGEPPPTPEEERRRLSRLRVLRFALTLVLAYAVSRSVGPSVRPSVPARITRLRLLPQSCCRFRRCCWNRN